SLAVRMRIAGAAHPAEETTVEVAHTCRGASGRPPLEIQRHSSEPVPDQAREPLLELLARRAPLPILETDLPRASELGLERGESRPRGSRIEEADGHFD